MDYAILRGVRVLTGVPVVAMALAAVPAQAEDYLIQGVQLAAAEMPHVAALLRRPAAGQSPETIQPLWVEQYDPIEDITLPQYAFEAYLDTGTSGVLISREIQEMLEIDLQLDSGGQPSQFGDITIDGTKSFYIGEQLYLSIAPFPLLNEPPLADLAAINQTFTAPQLVRPYTAPEYAPTNQLGQPQVRNVIGMPALAGKTMVVDATYYNHLPEYLAQDPDFIPFIQTSVHGSGDGAIPATDYTIRLSYADMADLTTTSPDEPGVEAPTLAHNPFIGRNPRLPAGDDDPPGVRIGRTGSDGTQYQSTGNWLLDTGAQITFMSTEQLGNIGMSLGTLPFLDVPVILDEKGNMDMSTFYVLVSGADAGSVSLLTGFLLEELVLPALEGDIIYRDVPVLVIDIEIADAEGNTMLLDGDIGMNLFLPSHDDAGNNLVSSGFDYFVFDEASGELRLVSVPEPAMFGLAVMMLGFGLLQRQRIA